MQIQLIYAVGTARNLIGVFNGTQDEAVIYIMKIFEKHQIHPSNYETRENKQCFVRLRWEEKDMENFQAVNAKAYKVLEELALIEEDVNSCCICFKKDHPPHLYEVETLEIPEQGNYKIIGTYYN